MRDTRRGAIVRGVMSEPDLTPLTLDEALARAADENGLAEYYSIQTIFFK